MNKCIRLICFCDDKNTRASSAAVASDEQNEASTSTRAATAAGAGDEKLFTVKTLVVASENDYSIQQNIGSYCSTAEKCTDRCTDINDALLVTSTGGRGGGGGGGGGGALSGEAAERKVHTSMQLATQ